MRAIMAMVQRDFKSIIFSPLFFLIAGIFTILWNLNFSSGIYNFSLASDQMKYTGRAGLSLYHSLFLSHFAYYNIIITFVAPALTMKLFVQEKESGTYDLLLTCPVTSAQIAIAKFLAGFLAAMCFALIGFLYPLSMIFLTDFNYWPLFSVFLGVTGITGLYISMGLFCSSLTRSLILAVILGVVFNFGLWFISQAPVATDSETASSFFEQFSLIQHFQYLLIGKVKISSLVYFLSGIALFTFFTERVIEASRWRS